MGYIGGGTQSGQGGGGGSSTITSFLGSSVAGPMNIKQIGGSAFSLGQQLAAASLSVVLASDQAAIPVSQSGTWNIGNITGTVSLPTGAATGTKQDTGNTSLGNIDTNTTNLPNVIGTAASAIPSKLLQIGGSDGTNARAIKTNSSGQLDVRPLTSSDTVTVVQGTASNLLAQVTNAGTFAVQSTLQAGTNQIGHLEANQSVNVAQINGVTPLMGAGNTGTGSPRVTLATDQAAIPTWGHGATGSAVPSGAQYDGKIAKTALPSAGTDGNLVGAMADKFGRQVVLPVAMRDLIGTQTTTISASTSETTIVTAAASTFNDLIMLIISNTSASTNTRIDFRDTTTGTILFSLESVGGAAPVGFSLPVPIPQTSVNTNWTAQCSVSTTDIRIYAVFVKNK